tara:strand:- start:1494 stop:2105 length:612 start_codon:yes stop_codon:yes gene_type:complete
MSIDIYKASDKEMANSQIDYYIKKGIFKEPGQVDKNTFDITTDKFKSMSKTEQDIWFDDVSTEWWDSIAKEEINNIYSNTLIEGNVNGSVLSFWNEHLNNNMNIFSDLVGIDKYKTQIEELGTNVEVDEEDALLQFITERGIKITTEELDDIRQALKKRRLSGGCGMWKTTGIPYLYKHSPDDLYDFEKEWYEKKLKINNKDV